MLRLISWTPATIVVICLLTAAASAAIFVQERGDWPDDWPEELEALREASRTIGVGTGIQENIYEIPLPNRETFEKIWPAILKVRSPNGTLTLRRTDSQPPAGWADLLHNQTAMIRIHAPSRGISMRDGVHVDPQNPPDWEKLIEEGRALRAEAPWPERIVGKGGELPEYVVSQVVDGRLTWLPADPHDEHQRELFPGFFNRARIDVELIIDGQVIDLNRIRLPDGAAIVDRRFEDAARGLVVESVEDADHDGK